GGVTTNAVFLARVLRHDDFLAGVTTTDFIDRTGVAVARTAEPEQLERTAITAALWLQDRNRAESPVLADLPSGWRNARLPHQHVALAVAGDQIDVRYQARRD